MPSILETLTRTFDDGLSGQLGERLGADPRATRTALEAAVPLLVAALARNAATPSGADSLEGAIERDHDGSLLDDLGSLIERGATRDGGKIIGHVFGSRAPAAERVISKKSGLDLAKVAQLLQIVAPMVLAALAKRRATGSTQASRAPSITDLLTREVGAVKANGKASDFLTSLLDADGDGSVLDDIAKRGLGMLQGAARGGGSRFA